MDDYFLHAAKLGQAATLLKQHDLDAWLVFVRETSVSADPALQLLFPGELTWPSAIIVSPDRKPVAIVGKLDDDATRGSGLFHEVIDYVQSIRQPLIATLTKLDPARIGINYSVDDVLADGLTHGMYLRLLELLQGTPYLRRLVSAGPMVAELRGVKTRPELRRVRDAIALTEVILDSLAGHAHVGMSETEIATFMQQQADARGAPLSWNRRMCPIVNCGAESMAGHGVPSPAIRLDAGQVLHVDFGVRVGGYCGDIQRCWYAPRAGEAAPRPAVQRAFDAVLGAIDAAAAALKPGVVAWQVDAAARAHIENAGYPAYPHATGHHVGRQVHDGGAVLGPRWPRYGKTPEMTVRAGHVYTLEPSILDADGAGCVSVEEMVVVTEDGCEFLSQRQRHLPLLGRTWRS